jgi:hypothetical protein
MTTARTSHASLPVTVAGAQMALVVGGTASSASSPPPLASAELYDPTTKTFTATGSMATARSGFGMVALANGKILVVGGIDPTIATGDQALASCEIYDPATGLWSAAASLSRPRNASVSVLLKNGNVLTTGGTQFVKSGTGTVISYLLSTEIYDPIADAWTAGPPMLSAHVGHTATALANGEVLIAGGQANLATVSGDGEIFSDAGLACTTSAQCGTGFCVDGVCCASACTDPCGACNLPSSLGTCAAVTGATVGTTRVACSGAGTDCGLQCTGASTTCAYPTAAITCGAATCASGSATHVGTCDGKGDCTASPPEACAPYVCGATACKSACATSNDCATGFTCSTGVCAAASTKCSTDGTSQIDADGSVHLLADLHDELRLHFGRHLRHGVTIVHVGERGRRELRRLHDQRVDDRRRRGRRAWARVRDRGDAPRATAPRTSLTIDEAITS